jgi:hypothetical protein
MSATISQPNSGSGVVFVCPGVDEYGHGLTARVVHFGQCCALFAQLPADQQKTVGLRVPSAWAHQQEGDVPR